MSNDDLHHTSDDPARVHSSDAWEDVSQVDIPELSDFGVLPGAADLPELPQLPELDALREPAMPEIVMPDLAMPDLNQFLAVTPPAPADISQPDAATTASPRKAPTGAQAPRPTITFEPTPARPPRASVPPEAEKAEPPHRVRRSHRDRLRRVIPLVHSRRFIVDTLGHADLVERQHAGELRGARVCGGAAAPLARIPRQRHEHAFHIAAVGLRRGDRVDA